ncbi:uncharacterized protein RCC_02656 [Ramularia collo-cygni]|uniref:Uncharacterized protein n=1 Tax=Ramularia collo-cygni TaxID=112498 RepID=A0A2D3UMR2_9PEZI|nr:uncharacterized protein RCC_02656 [Ramularia collo-cygni]CZT16822.1 uncharacterized protein RCC_02656 [Ramularia collo-cygni]
MRMMLAHRWRVPKIFIGLMMIEFALTVANLTLVGVAHPNTYRTKLWQNGFDKGFNSAPSSILYDLANWRPAHVPEIWSSYMTTFNMVISVVSMFILLVKSAMFVLHVFIPVISVFAHALLVALYSVSIYNQSRPDTSDPDLRSGSLPWYLSKGCSYADAANKGYCLQARATFAVAIVMTLLFALYLGYSIWSLFPTQGERVEREADYQSDLEMKKLSMYGMDDDLSREQRREQNRAIFLNLPKTPTFAPPFTPRTTAFQQLSGGQVGGYGNRGGAGPTTPLPFREQYGKTDAR